MTIIRYIKNYEDLTEKEKQILNKIRGEPINIDINNKLVVNILNDKVIIDLICYINSLRPSEPYITSVVETYIYSKYNIKVKLEDTIIDKIQNMAQITEEKIKEVSGNVKTGVIILTGIVGIGILTYTFYKLNSIIKGVVK